MSNEEFWPDTLRLRDTGIYDNDGGLGQRIYTTAGAGYKKVDYVRVDAVMRLDAVRQLAEQRAALLEALQGIAEYADGVSTPARNSVKKSDIARAAIANPTQQRNATGGEG